MAKVILKKAGAAATQSVLRELMPDIQKPFDALADEIRRMDARIEALDQRVRDGFERHLAVINEINNKLIRLDGKMEGYMEAMRLLQPLRPASRKRVG